MLPTQLAIRVSNRTASLLVLSAMFDVIVMFCLETVFANCPNVFVVYACVILADMAVKPMPPSMNLACVDAIDVESGATGVLKLDQRQRAERGQKLMNYDEARLCGDHPRT